MASPTAKELVAYLATTLPVDSPEYVFHLALAKNYNPAAGETVMSEEDLVAELNIASRTVRRLKALVKESGLWEFKAGSRHKAATYIPRFLGSLFYQRAHGSVLTSTDDAVLTSSDVANFVLTNQLHSYSSQGAWVLAAYLASHYNPDSDRAELTPQQIMADLKISRRSVMERSTELKKSGLWSIAQANGNRPVLCYPRFISEVRKEKLGAVSHV